MCRDGDAAAVGVMGCYPRRVNPDFEETAVCGCLLCGKLSAADETEEFLLRDSDKCPQGPRRPFPSDETPSVFQIRFKRETTKATSKWRADRDRAGAGHPEIDPHRRDGRSLPCPSHTSCTCDTQSERHSAARERMRVQSSSARAAAWPAATKASALSVYSTPTVGASSCGSS